MSCLLSLRNAKVAMVPPISAITRNTPSSALIVVPQDIIKKNPNQDSVIDERR